MKREDLLKALNHNRLGIDKDSQIDLFACFIFDGEQIVSSNDSVYTSYPFKTDFKCCVDGKRLLDFISRLTDENISIKLIKDNLVIRSSNTKASFKTIKYDNEKTNLMPPSLSTGKWEDLEDGFIDAIKLCCFSGENNIVNSMFSCLKIEGKSILCGCGYRASHFTLEKEMPLSIIEVDSIRKLNGNYNKYMKADQWLHLKNDSEAVYSFLLIEGEFPDFDQFFKGSTDISESIDLPEDLELALNLLDVVQNDLFALDKQANIEIKENKLLCYAETKVGRIAKTIDIEYDKEPLSFSVTPQAFAEAIKRSSKMILREDRIVFQNNKFKHCLGLRGEREE